MDAIAWDTAERVAIRVAGREPLSESYHYSSLEPDFREFTAEAEALVEAETGLRSLAGPARSRVTDRAGWSFFLRLPSPGRTGSHLCSCSPPSWASSR